MTDTIQITLNDVAIDGDFAPEVTLSEAILALEPHAPEGEVFTDIFVDEVPFHPDFNDIKLSAITTLSLRSQPVGDVAQAGTDNLGPVAELCSRHFTAAARSFRLGRLEEASHSFIAGADLLRDVLMFLSLLSKHHGLDEAHPAFVNFKEQEASLSAVLTELESAQTSKDWNQVADLIQYELTTRTTQLSNLGPTMAAPT
ncbi:MAG: hypothetical protein CMH57_03075 [Myxococcales bacterium]|nr:hypothetical protein [Myxococcales bacterium]